MEGEPKLLGDITFGKISTFTLSIGATGLEVRIDLIGTNANKVCGFIDWKRNLVPSPNIHDDAT